MDIFKEIAKGLIGHVIIIDKGEIKDMDLKALDDMTVTVIIDNIPNKGSNQSD